MHTGVNGWLLALFTHLAKRLNQPGYCFAETFATNNTRVERLSKIVLVGVGVTVGQKLGQLLERAILHKKLKIIDIRDAPIIGIGRLLCQYWLLFTMCYDGTTTQCAFRLG